MSESEGRSSGYLIDIPALWFIGLLMAGGAILGFAVEGFTFAGETASTMWAMALVAVIAFVFPYISR